MNSSIKRLYCTCRQLEPGMCICVKCGKGYPSNRPDKIRAYCTVSGLGDKVAALIHKVTKFRPCGGCRGRQARLNRLFAKYRTAHPSQMDTKEARTDS